MSESSIIPVFDGHNDVLLRLRRGGSNSVRSFLQGEAAGHIDLPKARRGGLAGGLCAVFIPSPDQPRDHNADFPAPPQSDALNETLAMFRLLLEIEAQSDGAVKVCRSASDIRSSIADGRFAAVFHIEGAEAIGADLDALHVLHQAGLRTLGPVWSRPNVFAYGVPFRFPSSPDIGPGLTEAGKDLIRACNELRILVDLSHMNEKGFWDIAKLSNAPLVASHSNAHKLSPHSRNLTDKQLDAIRDTGGLVGINFGVLFLREDGVRNTDTPLDVLVRHIAYIAERIGVEHVALGSDFDGTTIPQSLADASGLPKLIDALRAHGFDDRTLRMIAHENWVRILEQTWGS
ncbi:membrane dipeptidase [Rhizobium sp. P38BS-XIX]|uniref:dipeptidase n=1 Tax=Rhizobium sp. P38BS-XIX TaxID=2726740 RepID=UPI0014565E28|nr:dipeptidase [Rhizobium sp. P38BS-XIX]NLR97832.1 membrane dipeptidase [Rhizobium sp. P38BS-XIX]